MTTPKSIFAIEQGTYSDYRVVGVFSSKENAEIVAARINADDPYNHATVAEWPLDPAVNELNQGMSQFIVHMLKDGTVERCDPWEITGYGLAGEIHEWQREEAPAYRGTGKPNVLNATVWATDAQHAIKIVNEHRIQMLALGQWKGKL